MRYLIVFLLLLPSFAWALSDGATITTVDIIDMDSTTTTSYPLTFGHVFKEGDVPTEKYIGVKVGASEKTTQCNIKNTYSDGSARFAVISAIIPVTADATTTLTLYVATSSSTTGSMTEADMLDTSIEDEIRLTNLSDSGYSGSVTADLNAEIDTGDFDYWLEGSVCTEVIVRESLNNSLKAYWEVRFYPTASFGIRISHSIENMETQYRGQVGYDVDIQAGTPSLSSKYSQSTITHYPQGRWRRTYWVGTEPPEVEIQCNTAYWISTQMISNYDTSIEPTETYIASLYSAWGGKDTSIMGLGSLNSNWSDSGAHWYIGLSSNYDALHLLSGDNRIKEMLLENADLLASAPYHWRESDSGETNYESFMTITDHPSVYSTLSNCDNPGYEDLGTWIGTSTSQWSIDRAHTPAVSYYAYLISGEHFYLEEIQYKAANGISMCDPGSVPYGRDGSNGRLFDGQTRAVAWTFRDLIYAGMLSTETSDRTYFNDIIAYNITYFAAKDGTYPLQYWLPDSNASISGLTASVKYPVSPWMDDWLLMTLCSASELGYDLSDTTDWYSDFIIGRLTNTDFNNYNGCPYRFPAKLTDDSYPQTWTQAKDLFTAQPTAYPDNTDSDYGLIAIAASSFITGLTGGQDAYDFIVDNIGATDKAERNDVYIKWAILPRDATGGANQTQFGPGTTTFGSGTTTFGE